MKHISLFTLLLLSLATAANEAEVVDVKAKCHKECTFFVTVKHQDQGWNHYADRWEVLTPNGRVIAIRTLFHPHINEQPFMRSLSHIKIPSGVKNVVVRAHDSVHGYGSKTINVKINSNAD